jgi:hypothetical protein
VNPDDLIAIARNLAAGKVGGRRGRPKQSELRRAVSTAYFALFHILARCCADKLVGSTPAKRRQSAWHLAYRALEHGRAKNQCEKQEMQLFPTGIQDFGEWFVEMQRSRHRADYAPEATFSRSQVLQQIDESEKAMTGFRSTATMDQRAFAVHVLFKPRND